jgi:hypothetical protein
MFTALAAICVVIFTGPGPVIPVSGAVRNVAIPQLSVKAKT